MKKLSAKHFERLSTELDKEFSGGLDNTEPMTAADMKWFRCAVEDTSPKKQTSIRIRKWQIDFAKDLARKKHLRGYQTAIERILTRAMLSPSFIKAL